MELLTGQETQSFVQGLIHAKTQVGELWIDLTVAKIQRLTKRGSLDFGGSECLPAETVPLNAHKRRDEDKYGWWELRHGQYLVCYNEELHELPEDHAAFLSPHPRLTAACCSHPSSYLYRGDKLSAVLTIPEAGCALKENCRVSRLQVFKR